jgi:hypothetical protein
MITSFPLDKVYKADVKGPCCWGNILFMIAGVIGIATKNEYCFGFKKWTNQEYFVRSLPVMEEELESFTLPANYKGYDVGFQGFDFPDDRRLLGGFGSEKYFKHCEGLIRYYFEMKELREPYLNCIIISYREYEKEAASIFSRMDYHYFQEALKQFPSKKVVVVTNDIEAAKNTIKEDFEYVSISPIIDFYLLTKAEYLIMSNSTFSWWGAWLSKAKTVAPKKWFTGDFKDFPMKDWYCDDWVVL